MRGARSISKKRFPEAGIFREFSIEFREPKSGSGLASVSECAMTAFYDGLASNTACYFAACKHAAYLLRNSRPMLNQVRTYSALKVMLERMSVRDSSPEPWHTLAMLVFLDENGSLPKNINAQSSSAKLVERFLLSGVDSKISLPEVSASYMKKFSEWVHELGAWHERNSHPDGL